MPARYLRLASEDSEESDPGPRLFATVNGKSDALFGCFAKTVAGRLRGLPSSGLASLTNPLNRYQFNNTLILELCDSVRSYLQEDNSLGPRADEMVQLLRAMGNDESDGRYSVNMDTISACRLDKLLADIISPGKVCSEEQISIANNLQRKWRLRFRQEYFDLDKTRFTKLVAKYGQLRDVAFRDTQLFRHERWQAQRCESLSEVEGNQKFEPGQ